MNKHTFLFSILAILFANAGKAQSKSAEIEVDAKQKLTDIISIGGDGGFILHASEPEKKTVLCRYTPDLELSWQVEIDNQAIKGEKKHHYLYTVASEYSDYVYHLEYKYLQNDLEEMYIITRIDKVGNKSSVNFMLPKDLAEANIIAAYVDEAGFNLITTFVVKGDKKQESTAKLIRFNLRHNETTFEQFDFDIKGLFDEGIKIHFEFINQDKGHIYLAQKWVGLTQNAIKYRMFTLDKKDFRLVNEKDFVVELEHELVASLKDVENEGAHVLRQNRGYSVDIGAFATPGSFGGAKLDVKNNLFYIYGMISNRKFKDKKDKQKVVLVNEVGGGFVIKFDFNTGKEISRNELMLPKKAASEMSIIQFYLRNIWFDVFSDNTYRIVMQKESVSGFSKKAELYALIFSNNNLEYKNFTYTVDNPFQEYKWGIYDDIPRLKSNILLSPVYAPLEAINTFTEMQKDKSNKGVLYGILLSDRIILTNITTTKQKRKFELTSFKTIK
jgi:hypothetical protein